MDRVSGVFRCQPGRIIARCRSLYGVLVFCSKWHPELYGVQQCPSRELGGCKCLMLRRMWYAYRLPLCILLFTRLSLSRVGTELRENSGSNRGRHRVLTNSPLPRAQCLVPYSILLHSEGRLSAKMSDSETPEVDPQSLATGMHSRRLSLSASIPFLNGYNYKVSLFLVSCP